MREEVKTILFLSSVHANYHVVKNRESYNKIFIKKFNLQVLPSKGLDLERTKTPPQPI